MMSYPTRKLGNDNVSAIGFGAMGISAFYGAVEPDEERFKVLDAVYAAGCTFWDSANIYGDSEELIGKWFKRTGKRDEIFLATKFGIDRSRPSGVNGEPEQVKIQFEKSISRLGVDKVELYYLHRVDPVVPIELTVGAMAELVKEGRVKYLGLSECSAATLRRACAVHPIAAVQVEYSPFTLDIEDEKIGLLKAARELGVKIVAYSPLGRGLVTGQYTSPDDFDKDDFRRLVPRYSKENFPNILKLAANLKEIGEPIGATPGQVTLAWLLAQGDDIIPIPGTKKIKYFEENNQAAYVKLSPDDVQKVRTVSEMADWAPGDRYPAGSISLMFGDTPELK